MGQDKQMAEYLCETCKHRKGKLAVYHRIDSQGIERSYTNVVRVNCAESKKHPGLVRDAVRDTGGAETHGQASYTGTGFDGC